MFTSRKALDIKKVPGFMGGYLYDYGDWVGGVELQYDFCDISYDDTNLRVVLPLVRGDNYVPTTHNPLTIAHTVKVRIEWTVRQLDCLPGIAFRYFSEAPFANQLLIELRH